MNSIKRKRRTSVRPSGGGIQYGLSCAVFAVYALFAGLNAGPASAQRGPGIPSKENKTENHPKLKFMGAPMNQLWEMYGEITGRTLLLAPQLPNQTVTLRSETDLTREDTLQAIETVLAMHGVALLKEGEKFIRVVPIAKAREEPMPIRETIDPEKEIKDSPKLISQMITLKHIDIGEAINAINPFKHSQYGKIATFERTNSILITDSAANINRMIQIISHLDQPSVAREEPHIIQIRYAKAADIKTKLEEIIAKSNEQQEQKKKTTSRVARSGSPRVVRRTLPGVIRPPQQETKAPEPEDMEEIIEQAEKGIIRGKVHIISDERTNLLIIITRPENMRFFEKIIKVLDVESGPDVIVRVFRLEFADAENVSSMLNTLIGAASAKDAPVARSGSDASAEDAGSVALREYLRRREQLETAGETKSKVGELSAEDIKILSDKRTNSLVIMASKGDLETLEEIIRDMDTMLAQVLIESVIIDVTLGDGLQTGVDWLQRSLVTYEQNNGRDPVFAHTGTFGGGQLSPRSALESVTGGPGGLTHYFTFFDLSLDMVVQMVATDDRTKIIAAPVVLTTDNTEATITATEKIYVFKGVKYDDNSQAYDDYDTEPVGLTLKVKPQINKQKVVMMTISQTMSEPGSVGEPVSGASVSRERTLDASIAVKDRQTIVLGGQIRNQTSRTRTKVPLLGSIPLLGRLFSYNTTSETRREMVVFITPYVLSSDEEIDLESMHRKMGVEAGEMWKDNWSGSKMAEPTKGGRRAREEAIEKFLEQQESQKQESGKEMRPAKEAPGIDLDPELLKFIRRQRELRTNDIPAAAMPD